MCSNQQTAFGSRIQAFSLVEVVIALSILAIALSALGSSIFSLNQGNKMIQENRRAVAVAQKILERLQAEPWDQLGKTPATWHRREAETAGLQYVDELNFIGDDEFMHRPLVDEPAGNVLYDYLQYGNANVHHISKREDEAPPEDLTIEDFVRDPYGLPYVKKNQRAEFNGVDGDSLPPVRGTLPTDIANYYDTSERYNWLQFLGMLDGRSGLNNLRVYIEYYDSMESMEGILHRDQFNAAIAEAKHQLEQSHALLDLEDLDDLDAESVVIRVIVVWNRDTGGEGRHELTVARRQ